jgi:thiosulfate/3-mercaptopyruvate sulfurtransferase
MNPRVHWLKNRCASLEKSLGTVTSRFRAVSFVAALVILLAASGALISVLAVRGQENRPPDPWTASQTVQPADLARELGDKNGTPPTIVYVGFHTLFAGGHIPGATFHGSASTEQGLSDLKKWAEELPRTANLVIYCGCCPLEKCPNIRPAFTALDTLGFKKLRVLVLPTSFATDWADKGYPLEKGM